MALYETAGTIAAKFENLRNNLKNGFKASNNDTTRLEIIAGEFESSLVAQQKAEIKILSLQQELDASKFAQPGSGSVGELALNLNSAVAKRIQTLKTLSAAIGDDNNAFASLKMDIEEVDDAALQLLAGERQRTVFHRIRANKLRDARDRSDIDLAQSRQIIKRFNRDPEMTGEDAKRLAAELQSQVVNTTRQLIDLRNIVPVSPNRYVFDSALDLADLDNDSIRAPMATKLESIKEELRDAIAALEQAVRNFPAEHDTRVTNKKLQSRIKRLEAAGPDPDAEETRRELAVAESQVTDLQQQIEAILGAKDYQDFDRSLLTEIETLKERISGQKEAIEDLETGREDLEAHIEDLESKLTKPQAGVPEPTTQHKASGAAHENLKDCEVRTESLLLEISQLKATAKTKGRELVKANLDLEHSEQDVDDRHLVIVTLRKQAVKLKDRIAQLQEEQGNLPHRDPKDPQVRDEALVEELGKFRSAATSSMNKLVVAKLKIANYEKEIRDLKNQGRSLQHEQIDGFETRVDDNLSSDMVETQRTIYATPESSVKAGKKRRKALVRATIDSDGDEGTELEIVIMALNDEISAWQENVRELEDTQRELNAEIERAQVRIEELENVADVNDEELSHLWSDYGGDAADIAALRAVIAMLKTQVAELSQQLEVCRAEKGRKKRIKGPPKPRGIKRKREDPALIQLQAWQHDRWFGYHPTKSMSNQPH